MQGLKCLHTISRASWLLDRDLQTQSLKNLTNTDYTESHLKSNEAYRAFWQIKVCFGISDFQIVVIFLLLLIFLPLFIVKHLTGPLLKKNTAILGKATDYFHTMNQAIKTSIIKCFNVYVRNQRVNDAPTKTSSSILTWETKISPSEDWSWKITTDTE